MASRALHKKSVMNDWLQHPETILTKQKSTEEI